MLLTSHVSAIGFIDNEKTYFFIAVFFVLRLSFTRQQYRYQQYKPYRTKHIRPLHYSAVRPFMGKLMAYEQRCPLQLGCCLGVC